MKKKLLFVTDLYYQAKGRIYYEEDMFLSEKLGQFFDLCLCHPKSATSFIENSNVILFRNTGPVMNFASQYNEFRSKALDTGSRVFNQLSGKADMKGKNYLIELTKAGYPVIPSVDRHKDLKSLPAVDNYIVKLKQGADSLGMNFVSDDELSRTELTGRLVQPVIDFVYEVSFYFINHQFQYALYAPNPDERWRLEPYIATPSDLKFSRRFIDWNGIDYGIQRVDACRTKDGDLLLMELEDLNPYLSLELLDDETRDSFVQNLSSALIAYAAT